MEMMLEDCKAFAVAERKAADALRGVDRLQVAAERGVFFNRQEGEFTAPFLDEILALLVIFIPKTLPFLE